MPMLTAAEGDDDGGPLWFPEDAPPPPAALALGAASAMLRPPAGVNGTRNILVVRVSAQNCANSYTKAELSDAWFGTDGDPVNARERFDACSHGKLLLVPAADTVNITDGVIDVVLDENITGMAGNTVKSMAHHSGQLSAADLEHDHIAYCIPPCSSSFLAFASLGMTVYYDWWCLSVSAQMHEIGHNLGLQHSGEDKADGTWRKYGDRTGCKNHDTVSGRPNAIFVL